MRLKLTTSKNGMVSYRIMLLTGWSCKNDPCDGLGTVRQTTDVSGELLSAQHYDLYGVPLQINGLRDVAGMGFTGEQTDSTGLVYLRAWHYNPSLGVFMSVDPVMADNLKFTVLFSAARTGLKYGRGLVDDFRSSYQLKGNLGLKEHLVLMDLV